MNDIEALVLRQPSHSGADTAEHLVEPGPGLLVRCFPFQPPSYAPPLGFEAIALPLGLGELALGIGVGDPALPVGREDLCTF
jgi:hypothetical protein